MQWNVILFVVNSFDWRSKLGGKVKSVYLTVCPKREHKSVLKKVFFDAKSYNEYVKNPEFVAKYPAELFDVIKEVY